MEDDSRSLSLQASGLHFQPSQVPLALSASFAPNTTASFGGSVGRVVAFGSALYAVPPDLPCGPRDSYFEVAFAHLAELLPAFRSAGATEFVLHLHRRFARECHEEFTRRELQALASLDCHLFYVARER